MMHYWLELQSMPQGLTLCRCASYNATQTLYHQNIKKTVMEKVACKDHDYNVVMFSS